MRAIVYTAYGPPEVLKLEDIAKPTPKHNEVLVQVYATTVTIGDVKMRSFNVPRGAWLFARIYLGIRKPKRSILGMELAGIIESTGKDVKGSRPLARPEEFLSGGSMGLFFRMYSHGLDHRTVEHHAFV